MSSQEFKIFAEMCFKFESNNKDFTTFLDKKKEKDKLIPRLFSVTTLITNVLSMIKEGKQPTLKLLPFQERNWNMIGHALLNWCIAESKDSMI